MSGGHPTRRLITPISPRRLIAIAHSSWVVAVARVTVAYQGRHVGGKFCGHDDTETNTRCSLMLSKESRLTPSSMQLACRHVVHRLAGCVCALVRRRGVRDVLR